MLAPLLVLRFQESQDLQRPAKMMAWRPMKRMANLLNRIAVLASGSDQQPGLTGQIGGRAGNLKLSVSSQAELPESLPELLIQRSNRRWNSSLRRKLLMWFLNYDPAALQESAFPRNPRLAR